MSHLFSPRFERTELPFVFWRFVFYGYWKPEMVLLLLFCISFNFAGGIWLGKTSAGIYGKRIFVF
ncbi:hypothetical protein LEP1GSC115_4087 [Leptospira interrogans serovar Australis str. 200703203]|uniref:Uncharacterized protein n=1 Tax=Leptospira interrogans serovar Australis str. 200703203 TaxID=1085541 RepID=N1UHF7_LEPIR|nr:hypothetical protein LEP1GSC115_4087 [Leptospira interrogans serovar Australis str. 200703203]